MSKATVTLNGREVTLAWTNLARYRLSQLPSIPKLEGHQIYAAICQWVWAMLPKELAHIYPDPEDLARHIDPADCGAELDAIADALESLEPDSKKKTTSTPRRKSASRQK